MGLKENMALISVIAVASPSIVNAAVWTVSPAEREVFQSLPDAQLKVLDGATREERQKILKGLDARAMRHSWRRQRPYVLNGVLGVENEDLERDWESTFYNEGDIPGVEDPKHGRGTQHFDTGFSRYGQPGDTLQRRIELYLLDCGVTEKEIARFRAIMTEE